MKPSVHHIKLVLGTDFSGIGSAEIAADILAKYNSNAGVRIQLICEFASETSTPASIFGRKHHRTKRFYGSVRQRQLATQNGKHPAISLYVAGPPCISFSSAGKRKRFRAKSARLFTVTVEGIISMKPLAFIIENVPSITKESKFKEAKKDLDNADYITTLHFLDARDVGLPQNRKRMFLVGRHKVLCERHFEVGHAIQQVELQRLLRPPSPTDNPEHVPRSKVARLNVEDAKQRMKRENNWPPTSELVVNTTISRSWRKNKVPIARPYSPCLTHSLHQGHWLLKRGRPMTPMEAARLQGIPYHYFTWPPKVDDQFGLIGNAIPIPMVGKLILAICKCLGSNEIVDPWATGGAAWKDLYDDALMDATKASKQTLLKKWAFERNHTRDVDAPNKAMLEQA